MNAINHTNPSNSMLCQLSQIICDAVEKELSRRKQEEQQRQQQRCFEAKGWLNEMESFDRF